MNHWVIAPILLPLLIGSVQLLLGTARPGLQRGLGLTGTAALIPLATVLLVQTGDGIPEAYAVGEWSAPFGIALVADSLSASLLLLTACVALPCLLYATTSDDSEGPRFHALFQFQLLGVNGAFLTGDLFNLFVFFEILLIASFALLLHGSGLQRSRAAIHLVALNLAGSAIFLIAIGALYGAAGTLNLAHLARIVPQLNGNQAALAHTSALLLLIVFGLKAAVFPLGFWLAQSYSAAAASVAALFSLMTKVGAYSIMRVYPLVFDADAGELAEIARPWLLPAALVTLAMGTIGTLAASTLRSLVAWLLVISIGIVLIGVGLFSAAGLAAAIFYTVHSTLVTAALFLIADLIGRQRAGTGDRLDSSAPVHQPALLGTFFVIGAVAVTGLPPFAGFLGKILILRAALPHSTNAWLWAAVLLSSLAILLAGARAGSIVFWKVGDAVAAELRAPRRGVLAVLALLALNILLMLFGSHATDYASEVARQLMTPGAYEAAVLGDDLVSDVRSGDSP